MPSSDSSVVRSWSLVIPVKETRLAKSRLTGFDPATRSRLALAFALDTVMAALECAWVRRVVVVTNDGAAKHFAALGADVVTDDPAAGLNPALVHAEAVVRARDPLAAVAAISADLPALTPDALNAAFAAAVPARWFVSDSDGVGTTLLASGATTQLCPAFGSDSRIAHLKQGAKELDLPDLEGLRRDVDTARDLSAALRLGVGLNTKAVLEGR
ncbi:MAG: 2-phospho-L-lactate guanylyltransferase [Nocardioidaceae bacterium]